VLTTISYEESDSRSRINVSRALAVWCIELSKDWLMSSDCNGCGRETVMMLGSTDLGRLSFTVKVL
jgi:hypothetical protein